MFIWIAVLTIDKAVLALVILHYIVVLTYELCNGF